MVIQAPGIFQHRSGLIGVHCVALYISVGIGTRYQNGNRRYVQRMMKSWDMLKNGINGGAFVTHGGYRNECYYQGKILPELFISGQTITLKLEDSFLRRMLISTFSGQTV